mmetsp:Transcript_96824/g.298484  ORF Transcript_96824/g.298484 Transcript_96824/m.298484 type:complete len:209 (+) Transcript_96824:433-1059(+)
MRAPGVSTTSCCWMGWPFTSTEFGESFLRRRADISAVNSTWLREITVRSASSGTSLETKFGCCCLPTVHAPSPALSTRHLCFGGMLRRSTPEACTHSRTASASSAGGVPGGAVAPPRPSVANSQPLSRSSLTRSAKRPGVSAGAGALMWPGAGALYICGFVTGGASPAWGARARPPIWGRVGGSVVALGTWPSPICGLVGGPTPGPPG